MIPALAGGLLAGAGLLLPGAGWAFAYRWPAPWLASGIISGLAIFAGVLGFALAGIPITLLSLGLWLGAVTLAGVWCLRRRRPGPASGESWSGWWLALPAVPMVLVALWRAGLEPLSGADNVFRWDHLAQLIVRTGHLDYYPPHTADGFALYFWADGIAPLVSGLYAWTYFAADSSASGWTAIPVLLQMAGLIVLLFQLGQGWGGVRGGWFAVALGGATMLLQFAFGLGQETGCTALGAGGMAFYLTQWDRTRAAHLLVPAAGCAAFAACAREYGAAFLLVGVLWVWRASSSWKRALGFAAGAGLLPLAWHTRNWILTGNPLYAMDVAGLFPLNPVFNAWMQGYVRIHGKVLLEPTGWREIARLLLMSAVPALLGFAAGALVWRRQTAARWWVVLGAAGGLVWIASVPYTAGGPIYSMRVLSPLLVLGCAWGGGVLARWVPGRRHLGGVLAGLAIFGGDAALRAWTMPLNPYAIPAHEWPGAGYRVQLDFIRNDEGFVRAAAHTATGKVLSDSAGVQALLQAEGKTLVPFWSPEVAFLFSPDFKADAAGRLRELGYTHVLLKRVPFTVDFLTRTGVLSRLDGHLKATLGNDTYILFELQDKAEAGRPEHG